jgi:hypothetical protein
MAYTQTASGISSQLVYAQEALDASGTWGVVPTAIVAGGVTNTAVPLEFKSETLALKKTTVVGQGLHAGGLFDRSSRRVLTNYDAGGSISFDLPNRNLLQLLMHMTGSPNTTYTGTTTLYTPAQIASSGAYQSYHTPGSTYGMSLVWQKGVPTADAAGSVVVEPFTYVGCKISEWEISVQSGAIAQTQFTIDARNELAGAPTNNGDPLNTVTPALVSFSESNISSTTDPLNVFHFKEATLIVGGTVSMTNGVLATNGSAGANIKSASMKETHALDTTRYFLGSNGFKAEQIENGFRQLTGSFVAEFLSAETYYNAFAADTTTCLQLKFIGNTAGTSGTNTDTLVITFPSVKLDGESPMVGGPGVVTENVAFTAFDDNLTCPYQINYISSDASTTA